MDLNLLYFLVIAIIKLLHKISDSDTIDISHPESEVDGDLKKILMLFKSLLVNGCSESDVPILDPYDFKHYEGTFSGDILSYAIDIDGGVITGLSDFEIFEFSFEKANLSMHVNVYFPLLQLHSENYNLEGNLFQIFPLSGRGIVNFEVHNLTVSSNVFFTQSDDEKSLIIDHFEDPQFSIAYISVRTETDNNIDEIFNALVKDVLANYLTRYNKYISNKYSTNVADAINKLLNKLETWRLIEEYLQVYKKK